MQGIGLEAKEQKPFTVKAVCTTCGKEVPLFQKDKADESTCVCDKQDCDIEAVKIRVSGDPVEPGPPPLSEKAVELGIDSSLNFKPNLPLAISPATESEYFIKPGYKLVSALGEGSMGSAYKVHSESLGTDFVIKKLNPVLSENPRTAKRWRLSGSEVIQLSHPNMESIYEVDIAQDGSSYMVTEAVEGEPLAKLIQREGFMEAGEVIEIAKQVCEALAYVHENGVLHRGINPRNIFLLKAKEGKYSVKLTDCGTARAWPSSGRETRFLLSDGKEFGDPRYMSPEQCSGQRLTESADIYSFGCVMYEALGGKPPFSSRNPNQTAVKQLTADIRPLSDRFRDLDIPPDLEAIVMKALQKDPIRRYKSAKEMLQDLEKLGTQKSLTKARSTARKIELPDWMKGEFDLRKLIILFATTAIVSALCGLIYSVNEHRQNPTVPPASIPAPFDTTSPVRSFLEKDDYIPLSPDNQADVFDINGNKVKSSDLPTRSESIQAMASNNEDLRMLDCHGVALSLQVPIPKSFWKSDFTHASISKSNLIGSSFREAKFLRANLTENSLDRSQFESCDATQARFVRNQLAKSNLSSGNFKTATFSNNDLTRALARFANFQDAQFFGDSMENANFSEATMRSVRFWNVSADGAQFIRTTLDQITSSGSHFAHCNFAMASMISAHLKSAKMFDSNFSGASLKDADLSSTYLCHSDFQNADLHGANLSNANLSDCDFSNANLSFADLTNADLTHAKFDGANLTGAKLDSDPPMAAKIKAEMFKHAVFDKN